MSEKIEEMRDVSLEEKLYTATQWQLIWRKFKKHKLAMVGGVMLIVLYLGVVFPEFISTMDIYKADKRFIYMPPQRIHLIDGDGRFHLRPFVYGVERKINPNTFRKIYSENKAEIYPIYFFNRGDSYKFWNLFETDVHLFGVKEPGVLFLLGTDKLGRDLFSRTILASRVSLTIGLVGVAFSFVLGCVLGGVSGYFGGVPDMVIQRIIEFLFSLPAIPLWMALAAALPPGWSPIKTYFGITLILSILGWTNLARVVRGRIFELREEDFVMAAKVSGAGEGRIIAAHLLPSLSSYLIVSLTLAIPLMILAETSLSFLGVGLRPPVVSWGVLLKQGQNFRTVSLHPWLLAPGLFVIATVLGFNFLGDGLRDAADPYK